MKRSMVEATFTQENVQKYYGWRAANYDAGSGFEIGPHAEALKLADIQTGQHVLDLACGTGRGTVGLARAVGASGRVDALDLSEAMLAQARSKIDSLGLSSQVVFQHGNARQLPYPDQSFDLLYNAYMFDLIPLDGFMPILREMARVLKPGGELVLLNMSKPDERRTWFEAVYEKIKFEPCRPVLISPYVESAGFTDVRRVYQPTRASIVALLWGQEIVLGRKSA